MELKMYKFTVRSNDQCQPMNLENIAIILSDYFGVLYDVNIEDSEIMIAPLLRALKGVNELDQQTVIFKLHSLDHKNVFEAALTDHKGNIDSDLQWEIDE